MAQQHTRVIPFNAKAYWALNHVRFRAESGGNQKETYYIQNRKGNMLYILIAEFW